ncbi:MAG: RpiB/LacA/LacB family sugar-phosphate isomerase [Merdibacter sp.]
MPCAQAVAKGEAERGIVPCGTGIGVSITANKVKGIRCALCSDPLSARLTREHTTATLAMDSASSAASWREIVVYGFHAVQRRERY